jgi:hypothetical protein
MALFTTIAGSTILAGLANAGVAAGASSLAKKAIGGKKSSGRGQAPASSGGGGGFNLNTAAATSSTKTNSGPPAAREVDEKEHPALRSAKMWNQRLDLSEI